MYDHRTILQRLQRGGASFARFSNTIVDRGSPKGFGGSCAQMVEDALAEAADGLSYMQWEDLRTDGVHNSKVSPDMLLNMSEALFLLVRAPGTWSFFGASTGWGKPSWSWEPTYDRLKAIGGPVGNATRLGGGHWSREYEHATVKLFCPPAGSNDNANGSVTLKSDDPQAGGLGLEIQSSGSFSISVSGTEWLEGLPPSLHTGGAWHQHGLTAPKPSSGSDGIGQFTAKTFAVKDSAGNEAELIFRQYDGGQTIVFALRLPAGANGTRTTDSATACKNCVSVAALAFAVLIQQPQRKLLHRSGRPLPTTSPAASGKGRGPSAKSSRRRSSLPGSLAAVCCQSWASRPGSLRLGWTTRAGTAAPPERQLRQALAQPCAAMATPTWIQPAVLPSCCSRSLTRPPSRSGRWTTS